MTQYATEKQSLAAELTRTRWRTLALAEAVSGESGRLQAHPGYSPFDWHLGHIGLTESLWVLQQAAGQDSTRPDLDFVFSNVTENPKNGRVRLPDRETILRYLESIRMQTVDFLSAADFTSPDPLLRDGYCFRFALAHEWQHQETMVELLHLTDHVCPIEPLAGRPERVTRVFPDGAASEALVPAGRFQMGADCIHAYDNEKPAHQASTAAYYIDSFPVTMAQYQEFMDDGGYRRRAFWDEDGWAWVRDGGIESPEHFGRGPFGPRENDPGEPVASVSWYEAGAYAKWAGKRLPTEAEWEKAASWNPATGEVSRYPWGDAEPSPERADYDAADWKPQTVGSFPAGRSPVGCLGMAGGVWEWTSSTFAPYPGFHAFPYDGYSKDHFDGTLKVLKGGSWATRGPLLRCTFRNFYAPGYRQGFLGFRCARSLGQE